MGYRPRNIAVNNRTNRIYVTDEGTSELLVIDGSNHAITNRILIPPPAPPISTPLLDRSQRHLAVSERLNRIYLPRTSYDSSSARIFDHSLTSSMEEQIKSVAQSLWIPRLATMQTVSRSTTPGVGFMWSRHAKVATLHGHVMLVVYDADTEARLRRSTWAGISSVRTRGLAANPVTGRVYISLDPQRGHCRWQYEYQNRRGEFGGRGDRHQPKDKQNLRHGLASGGVAVINGATDSLETTFPIQNRNDFVVRASTWMR